ncbi:uncharacterized protein V6R79_009481 [Siganus canaliculatus]
MHGHTGHSYTKHRDRQLQSHLSTFLHHVFTHSLPLVDEEAADCRMQTGLFTPEDSQKVNECTASDDVERKEKDQQRQQSNQNQTGTELLIDGTRPHKRSIVILSSIIII